MVGGSWGAAVRGRVDAYNFQKSLWRTVGSEFFSRFGAKFQDTEPHCRAFPTVFNEGQKYDMADVPFGNSFLVSESAFTGLKIELVQSFSACCSSQLQGFHHFLSRGEAVGLEELRELFFGGEAAAQDMSYKIN